MELVNDILKRQNRGKCGLNKLVLTPDNFKQKLEDENLWRISYPAPNLSSHMEFIEQWGKKNILPYFTIDDDNRRQYGHFMLWLRADERFKCLDPATGEEREGRPNAGIYVAGNCGSGKTWLMRAMRGYSTECNIVFRKGEKVIPLVWKPYRAAEIAAQYEQLGDFGLEYFKKAHILCIEDLGSETKEVLHMGTRCNPLAQVLEYRGDNAEKCLTLITSNVRINDPLITQMYGERVASRLMLMCNYLELAGRDRRREQ